MPATRRLGKSQIVALVAAFLIVFALLESISSRRRQLDLRHLVAPGQYVRLPGQGPRPIEPDRPWDEQVDARKGFYEDWYVAQAPARPKGGLSDEVLAQTVHVLSANMAFADLTVNYLCKAARVAPVELLVVAQDARFHALLRSLAIPSVDITALGLAGADPTATDFASAPYRLIVEGKMRAVREVLRRGLHVLFADVDAVLNGDPVPELRNDIDFQFQPDWPVADGYDKDDMQPIQQPCTGFYFIKSNARTRAFLDAVIDRFPDDLDGNDQAILAGELQRRREAGSAIYVPHPLDSRSSRLLAAESAASDRQLSFTNLPYLRFPPGWLWILNRPYHAILSFLSHAPLEPVVAHANWVVGRERKVEALRERGWWVVEDERLGVYVDRFERAWEAGERTEEGVRWETFCAPFE